MMNYYAQGGQAQGIKSLAQELPNYGRYNDDMVAHISSDEARLLKSLGGAGTINPVTGLPEFFVKKLAKAVEKPFRSSGPIGKIIKPVVEPLRDIIQDLGPVGTIAATYFGGPIGAGIVGGLSGQKGFDFKRALLSGALAYGAQNLAQGVSASSDAALSTAADVAAPSVTDVAATLGTDAATGYGSQAAMLAEQAAGFGDAGLANIASSGAYGAGSAANLVGAAADTTAGMADAYNAANQSVFDKGVQSLSNLGSNVGTDIKNLGSGAYNLASGNPAAINAFKASGATMTNTALPIVLGYSGVGAIDEAEKYQNEADLANAKSQAEYDEIMARIEASKQRGIEAMKRSPYMFAEGGEVPGYFNGALIKKLVGSVKSDDQVKEGLTSAGVKNEIMQDKTPEELRGYYTNLYGSKSLGSGILSNFKNRIAKSGEGSGGFQLASTNVPAPTDDQRSAFVAMINNPYQFAYGGPVDDEPGFDDFNNYMGGGIASMAKGGMAPRFLSGGGDGMSDDIKATINGKQPARLADGEFVIPADVVSHLGNGSSKAGAKQLYSMMDKVRTARTGNKKQGKQINPAKYMPA
jgi:hypothetical protein